MSLSSVDGQTLTDLGTALFRTTFITSDTGSQKAALHAALMQNPEVLAICQSLFWGTNRYQEERHDGAT
jgi:hypothetical protein